MHSNMCEAAVVLQRSSHNADLQSQPVFVLQCSFVGGLRRQMLMKALHSPECHAWPVHLSVRPEVSWVSSAGRLCKLCNV